MAVHIEIEAWTEEEAGSPTAWAVPHLATDGRFCFRVTVIRPERV